MHKERQKVSLNSHISYIYFFQPSSSSPTRLCNVVLVSTEVDMRREAAAKLKSWLRSLIHAYTCVQHVSYTKLEEHTLTAGTYDNLIKNQITINYFHVCALVLRLAWWSFLKSGEKFKSLNQNVVHCMMQLIMSNVFH